MFDCEGEVLFLHELEQSNMLDNCGFWSKIKKVLNTKAGIIGTVATVATCAVVGVVCEVVPGGQLVTAACIGAAVGAIGGGVTAAVSTYNADGSIDWDAVVCFSAAGAVVGAVTSGLSFHITSKLINFNEMKKILKLSDNNPTSKSTYIGKYYKDSPKSYEALAKANNGNYFQLDNWDDLVLKYGDDALEEVNKNFIRTKYNAGNEFITNINPYGEEATGAFGKELELLKELSNDSLILSKISEIYEIPLSDINYRDNGIYYNDNENDYKKTDDEYMIKCLIRLKEYIDSNRLSFCYYSKDYERRFFVLNGKVKELPIGIDLDKETELSYGDEAYLIENNKVIYEWDKNPKRRRK